MCSGRDALDFDAALELANDHAQCDVELQDALVAWLMVRLEALAGSVAGDGPVELDEEIGRATQVADDDDHNLFRIVDKWLAPFPARVRTHRQWAMQNQGSSYDRGSLGAQVRKCKRLSR